MPLFHLYFQTKFNISCYILRVLPPAELEQNKKVIARRNWLLFFLHLVYSSLLLLLSPTSANHISLRTNNHTIKCECGRKREINKMKWCSWKNNDRRRWNQKKNHGRNEIKTFNRRKEMGTIAENHLIDSIRRFLNAYMYMRKIYKECIDLISWTFKIIWQNVR
jgi:hypothetical protein